MDRWTQIEFFVQVAELGSLSKAAEKLDLSNAAASRILSALEERLGARLVERTTRRQWLTEGATSTAAAPRYSRKWPKPRPRSMKGR